MSAWESVWVCERVCVYAWERLNMYVCERVCACEGMLACESMCDSESVRVCMGEKVYVRKRDCLWKRECMRESVCVWECVCVCVCERQNVFVWEREIERTRKREWARVKERASMREFARVRKSERERESMWWIAEPYIQRGFTNSLWIQSQEQWNLLMYYNQELPGIAAKWTIAVRPKWYLELNHICKHAMTCHGCSDSLMNLMKLKMTTMNSDIRWQLTAYGDYW